MNGENSLLKDYFLNGVNITSDIRAKGEFKYFYIGENSSETDKSFLYFSTMWYTEKITKDMQIVCSCYNHISTGQLYYNTKTKIYNLFIYKNVMDNKNENLSLKLHRIINIAPLKRNFNQNNNQKNQEEKEYQSIMNSKVYLASQDFILLNEIDSRILLININTGKFITIFRKSYDDNEIFYNLFDTYDETIIINGEQNIRTYAFLSLKKKDRKTPTYSYSYFIIQNSIEKNIHLHPINLDLGNSEPIGAKIAKIFHKDENKEQKCFFIFCFLSATVSLQFITNYDNLTLHQMFQKYCKIGKDNDKGSSMSIKTKKFWINKSLIKVEKIQLSQGMNIYLNINTKKTCALIYYFQTKGVISYLFNYTDSPQTVSEKIFIKQKELNLSSGLNYIKGKNIKAKTYYFKEFYQFKDKCSFGYSDKNFLIFENNSINIYEQNSDYPIFTYEFFDETLSCLIIFENIGYTYILTEKKLFKIIYNDRYKIFDNEILFTKNKIHYYKYNYYKKGNSPDNLVYPLFEYKPEDIWNAYCNNLTIAPIKFPEENFWNDSMEIEEDEEFVIKMINKNFNYELEKYENKCALCNVECHMVCSHCGMRFYCSYEHFRYDYFNFHFFECQLIQLFQRTDIMKIKNLEIRYKILYNELIKTSGRILNFIFTRIANKNDYPYFLNMILILINILANFGFTTNLSDFYILNLNLLSDKRKYRHERCIFYLESIYYFVQLNLLKCTFTLRGGLYNLTDCYIKMIKSDIMPKLTPKTNNRFITLKIDKIKSNIIYENKYFSEFCSPLFFDLKRYTQNIGYNNLIDVAEEYIIYHLKSLSLLAKFKIKIHSTIEVHNLLVDIILMFDDHYSENITYKNIVPYCYFSTSFYLVEIGKIGQTVKLLQRMVGDNYEVHLKNSLYALTYYNLGLLQYAIGYFELGIHNIEISYKIMTLNDFSDKIKFKIIDSLGLAYLNQKNLFKAYILIQTSIKARKKMNNEKYLLKCNRLYVYLNYIVDLYEYNYISKTRFLIDNKHKNEDKHKLIKFILGEEDKELVISEQNLVQFVKVVEFIWKLDEPSLKQLNTDNPPKVPSLIKEEIHHDRSFSGNPDFSQVSSFIYKDNSNEKNIIDEYEEDIEVKVNLYDSFSRQQQQQFKELKTIYLKRDIILRDSLGYIEKFNINYEPIFADEFLKIIEKLKVNFLLKDIFYCFQNEKWRDELYNYNQNNILFGLSKYLKLEKIQNMMAIEKSKNLEKKRKEKLELNAVNNLYDLDSFDDELNNFISTEDNWLLSQKDKEDNKYDFNKELSNLGENNKNKLNNKKDNMSFQKFKHKFKKALKQHEKNNKIVDLLDFIMDPNENYLYNLYENVYKNNPDKNFIFQNPTLVLNYIFIDINKPDSTPIVCKNNQIIKSVISNVKEEDEEYSLDSKNKKRKKIKNESNSSSEQSEEKKNKKNKKKKINKNISENEEDKNSSSFGITEKNFEEENSEDNINNIETKNLKKELEAKKENNNINNNSKDESTFLSLNKDNKIDAKNFIIVSKECTYIYIPKHKLPERLHGSVKNKKAKDNNNKFQKRLSLPLNNFKFNLLMMPQIKKQNSSTFKDKTKGEGKTFVEEIDKIFSSSLITQKEEEENQRTFALIQMKNRNIFSLMKSNNTSTDTSKILGKPIYEENFENRKKKFLLESLKTKNLWDKKYNKDNRYKNDKDNFYNKFVNNNKNKINEKYKIKLLTNELLRREASKNQKEIKKKNTEKAYLKQAINKQKQQKQKKILQKELTLKERKEKVLENDAMELIRSGILNKKINSEINMYMNNYKKLAQKEEKKEEKKENNKNTGVKSYVNMNYKKIKAKKNNNNNKSDFGLYEEEKRKILKYNNKLINLKMTGGIPNNNFTYDEDYYNVNKANNNSGNNIKKNIIDESTNNKNFIFENSSSYFNNLNSVNNSNFNNMINNKSNEISSERNLNQNINKNTTRLIQKYKLFPFLKKNNVFRVKENSGLISLSNTNTHTPKNKKKKIEKNICGLIKNYNKNVKQFRNGK